MAKKKVFVSSHRRAESGALVKVHRRKLKKGKTIIVKTHVRNPHNVEEYTREIDTATAIKKKKRNYKSNNPAKAQRKKPRKKTKIFGIKLW